MKMRSIWVIGWALVVLAAAAWAQTAPDPAKLIQVYQAQRNAAADAQAQCVASALDLQERVKELEKQLAEAKNEKAPN